jgi:hypothetical protein
MNSRRITTINNVANVKLPWAHKVATLASMSLVWTTNIAPTWTGYKVSSNTLSGMRYILVYRRDPVC